MKVLKSWYSLETGEYLGEEIVSGILATTFFPPEDGNFPEEQLEDFNFPQSEIKDGVVVGLNWSHVKEAEEYRHTGTNAWGVGL